MFGRKKKLIPPAVEALPDSEKPQAMAALYFLTLSGGGLKKLGVYPEKDKTDFNALVARMSAPYVMPADERDLDYLYEVSHCLRDGGTLLSSSQLSRGPYGDLLYRTDWAVSAVVGRMYQMDTGEFPIIDPGLTVPSPRMREFLEDFTARFADALTDSPSGTTEVASAPEILMSLAARDQEPPLVSAARKKAPLVDSVHGPGWFMDYGDMLAMTGDEQLSAQLSSAPSV